MNVCNNKTKRQHLRSEDLKLELGNKSIGNVNLENLLGFVIQKDVSWNVQVNRLVRTIKSKLYILTKSKHFLPVCAIIVSFSPILITACQQQSALYHSVTNSI